MKKVLISIVIFSIFLSGIAISSDNELVVYSARKEHLIKPLFDLYEKEHGVKVKYITGNAAALLQRIVSEGERTEADMLITVDAGNLWHAAQKNILFPVISEILEKNIPSHYRDPENRWFGLSVRARTIVYNTDNVQPSELSSYENLAAETWKNKLILRTSKKVYNQSLVAMLIAVNGEAKTFETIQGWVHNLAAPPYSSDTKVLEAIAAGQGDVGIINTYYYGRLIKEKPELPLALFWPDQEGNGVHVNVSGAGILKNSKNRESAIKFLEWLTQKEAQAIFADVNMEYPVNPSVQVNSLVQSWGEFNETKLNLEKAGALQADAIKVMDKAGYR